MAIVLCHAPAGGVGTTFLAAQVASALAARHEVTIAAADLGPALPVQLGLSPRFMPPPLGAPVGAGVVTSGMEVRAYDAESDDADFVSASLALPAASTAGILVIDLRSGDPAPAARLAAHGALHLCALHATPACIALLPRLLAPPDGTPPPLLVINELDETCRLERQAAAFIAELAGDRLIGKIRRDAAVDEALAQLQPLARHAPASAALADARALAAAVETLLAPTAKRSAA